MAYQVLARKYRSSSFDDLVGQDAIATTLKNAVAAGRVHHGYLFTGTRGVGKTSTARILAKALNCLEADAPTVTPCLKCASCTAIAEGEDIDVIEIDAASNTGVDNIRELRSNATLRPARARFKVYIIDEVHMLSTGAFNALLKTLEEPPEHVKFILATTELHKVPATIQSRCQRFSFRAVAPDAIATHLAGILKAESIKAEDGVVRRLSRLANGSVRDALSLMDMVLAFEAKNVTTAVMEQVLPPAHDEQLFALVGCLSTSDAAGALNKLEEIFAGGQTVARFCDGLIDYLRSLMLLRVCGAATELVDVPEQVRGAMNEQASRFPPPVYVYMITLVEEVRRAARYSGAGRALADAAVVRLAASGQFADIAALLGGGGASAGPDQKKNLTQAAAAVVETRSAPAPPPEHPGGSPMRASAARPASGEPSATRPVPAQPSIARSSPAEAAIATPGAASAVTAVSATPPTPAGPAQASRDGAAVGAVRESSRAGVIPTTPTGRPPAAPSQVASSAERARAASDPRVRRAMELVDGTLVAVSRPAHTIADEPVAAEAEPDSDAEPLNEEA